MVIVDGFAGLKNIRLTDLVIIAAPWEHVTREETDPLFGFLEEHAGRVMLVESPPVLSNVGNRNFREYASFLGLHPQAGKELVWQKYSLKNMRDVRKLLHEYVDRWKTFSFLPVADLFTREDGVLVAVGETVVYLDDDHLTDYGADIAAARFSLAIGHMLRGDGDSFPLVGRKGPEADKTLRATALPQGE